MLYQIKSYLKFLARSTNEHGVHSPFVYDLITACFYSKKKHPEYDSLKRFRDQLLSSHKEIEITDFGAGSRVFKSNTRRVSAIAKNAGVTSKRQQLLFRLTQYFQPKNTLELGTSLGLGTSAIAMGNTTEKVQTVEGCPNTAAIALNSFRKFQIENIELFVQKFEDFFQSKNCKDSYDLVYIDGNHSKNNTLQYFSIIKEKVHNNSVVIFDDIYWSKEMTEAWQEIIADEKVSVSINTFQWGLVFFRKEQLKQHFTIRL